MSKDAAAAKSLYAVHALSLVYAWIVIPIKNKKNLSMKMAKNRILSKIFFVCLSIVLSSCFSFGQICFNDSFNRPNNNTIGNTWLQSESEGAWMIDANTLNHKDYTESFVKLIDPLGHGMDEINISFTGAELNKYFYLRFGQNFSGIVKNDTWNYYNGAYFNSGKNLPADTACGFKYNCDNVSTCTNDIIYVDPFVSQPANYSLQLIKNGINITIRCFANDTLIGEKSRDLGWELYSDVLFYGGTTVAQFSRIDNFSICVNGSFSINETIPINETPIINYTKMTNFTGCELFEYNNINLPQMTPACNFSVYVPVYTANATGNCSCINGTDGIDGINSTFTDILNSSEFINNSNTWSLNMTFLYNWFLDLFYLKSQTNTTTEIITLIGQYSSGGNSSWNESLASSLYYRITNPSEYLNKTTIHNETIARIGDCPAGEVVMNSTIFGVQCVPMSGGSFNNRTDIDVNNLYASFYNWTVASNSTEYIYFDGKNLYFQMSFFNEMQANISNLSNLISQIQINLTNANLTIEITNRVNNDSALSTAIANRLNSSSIINLSTHKTITYPTTDSNYSIERPLSNYTIYSVSCISKIANLTGALFYVNLSLGSATAITTPMQCNNSQTTTQSVSQIVNSSTWIYWITYNTSTSVIPAFTTIEYLYTRAIG